MKQIPLLSILLSYLLSSYLPHSAAAQIDRKKPVTGKFVHQFGLGWNYAVISPDGFNRALTDFNENPNIGNAKFEAISWMHAPSLAFSIYGNPGEARARILFEISATGRWRNLKINNELLQTETRTTLHFHTLRVGFGTVPFQRENFDIGLGVGLEGGLLLAGVGSTTAEVVQTDFVYGVSVFMPINIALGQNVGFSLRPYYQYQLKEADFSEFYEKLNSYPPLDTEKLKTRLNNFGIEAHLTFFVASHDTATHSRKKGK
jgi:hypothetical protein